VRLSAQHALKLTPHVADLMVKPRWAAAPEGFGMKIADGPRDDRGFTLIELLVVIIIISILAAISVTNFLGQRSKGYDAQTKSDLRNAVGSMETYFADVEPNAYPATGSVASAALAPFGYKRSSNVSDIRIVVLPGETYKLSAFSQSGKQWCLNNSQGSVVALGPTTGGTVAVAPSPVEAGACT
jgi:type IV pilus assembly protein PilA